MKENYHQKKMNYHLFGKFTNNSSNIKIFFIYLTRL